MEFKTGQKVICISNFSGYVVDGPNKGSFEINTPIKGNEYTVSRIYDGYLILQEFPKTKSYKSKNFKPVTITEKEEFDFSEMKN